MATAAVAIHDMDSAVSVVLDVLDMVSTAWTALPPPVIALYLGLVSSAPSLVLDPRSIVAIRSLLLNLHALGLQTPRSSSSSSPPPPAGDVIVFLLEGVAAASSLTSAPLSPLIFEAYVQDALNGCLWINSPLAADLVSSLSPFLVDHEAQVSTLSSSSTPPKAREIIRNVVMTTLSKASQAAGVSPSSGRALLSALPLFVGFAAAREMAIRHSTGWLANAALSDPVEQLVRAVIAHTHNASRLDLQVVQGLVNLQMRKTTTHVQLIQSLVAHNIPAYRRVILSSLVFRELGTPKTTAYMGAIKSILSSSSPSPSSSSSSSSPTSAEFDLGCIIQAALMRQGAYRPVRSFCHILWSVVLPPYPGAPNSGPRVFDLIDFVSGLTSRPGSWPDDGSFDMPDWIRSTVEILVQASWAGLGWLDTPSSSSSSTSSTSSTESAQSLFLSSISKIHAIAIRWMCVNILPLAQNMSEKELVKHVERLVFLAPRSAYGMPEVPAGPAGRRLKFGLTTSAIQQGTLIDILRCGSIEPGTRLKLVHKLLTRAIHSPAAPAPVFSPDELIDAIFVPATMTWPLQLVQTAGTDLLPLAGERFVWMAHICLLLCASLSPFSIGEAVWNTLPPVRALISSLITGHPVAIPPPPPGVPSLATALESMEAHLKTWASSPWVAGKSPRPEAYKPFVILSPTAQLSSAVYRPALPEFVDRLLREMRGDDVITSAFTASRNPDFLLKVINHTTSGKHKIGLEWLKPLLTGETSRSLVGNVPLPSLCQLLLSAGSASGDLVELLASPIQAHLESGPDASRLVLETLLPALVSPDPQVRNTGSTALDVLFPPSWGASLPLLCADNAQLSLFVASTLGSALLVESDPARVRTYLDLVVSLRDIDSLARMLYARQLVFCSLARSHPDLLDAVTNLLVDAVLSPPTPHAMVSAADAESGTSGPSPGAVWLSWRGGQAQVVELDGELFDGAGLAVSLALERASVSDGALRFMDWLTREGAHVPLVRYSGEPSFDVLLGPSKSPLAGALLGAGSSAPHSAFVTHAVISACSLSDALALLAIPSLDSQVCLALQSGPACSGADVLSVDGLLADMGEIRLNLLASRVSSSSLLSTRVRHQLEVRRTHASSAAGPETVSMDLGSSSTRSTSVGQVSGWKDAVERGDRDAKAMTWAFAVATTADAVAAQSWAASPSTEKAALASAKGILSILESKMGNAGVDNNAIASRREADKEEDDVVTPSAVVERAVATRCRSLEGDVAAFERSAVGSGAVDAWRTAVGSGLITQVVGSPSLGVMPLVLGEVGRWLRVWDGALDMPGRVEAGLGLGPRFAHVPDVGNTVLLAGPLESLDVTGVRSVGEERILEAIRKGQGGQVARALRAMEALCNRTGLWSVYVEANCEKRKEGWELGRTPGVASPLALDAATLRGLGTLVGRGEASEAVFGTWARLLVRCAGNRDGLAAVVAGLEAGGSERYLSLLALKFPQVVGASHPGSLLGSVDQNGRLDWSSSGLDVEVHHLLCELDRSAGGAGAVGALGTLIRSHGPVVVRHVGSMLGILDAVVASGMTSLGHLRACIGILALLFALRGQVDDETKRGIAERMNEVYVVCARGGHQTEEVMWREKRRVVSLAARVQVVFAMETGFTITRPSDLVERGLVQFRVWPDGVRCPWIDVALGLATGNPMALVSYPPDLRLEDIQRAQRGDPLAGWTSVDRIAEALLSPDERVQQVAFAVIQEHLRCAPEHAVVVSRVLAQAVEDDRKDVLALLGAAEHREILFLLGKDGHGVLDVVASGVGDAERGFFVHQQNALLVK